MLLVVFAACSSGAEGGDATRGPVDGPGGAGGLGSSGASGSGGAGTGGATPTGSAGTSGSGAGNGGSSGTNGSGAGTGASAGNGDAAVAGSDGSELGDGGMACEFMGTPVDPSSLPSCESDTCKNAHCLPRSVITEQQGDLLADCDEDDECVPDVLIRTLGLVLLKTCESIDGAEGRCVSTCVPQVEAQLDVLPQDVCEDDERCAPCFDPVTGDETGACSQSCDPGPSEPAYTFPECCGGLSVCVPEALVPEDQRGMLDASGCSASGVLCAPKEMAHDRTAVPASCESLAGAEGRCLPACLPDIAAQADRLPQDSCDAGELCAPCFDPITGADTGACGIAADEPAEDPVLFAECCGGAAACVPSSLVPADQLDLLDADTCSGAGELCAPKDIASGSYQPDACMSWGGAEGRCLLACLPDVAARASQLTQDDCGSGELCVPCFDPLSGEDTGACTLEGDMPEDETPYAFPTCCDDGMGNDLGTCVPSELVPEDQVALLGADSCTDDGFLCAPTDVANASYTPIDCNSWLGAEARCLPECLPDVAAQAGSLQDPASDACAQGKLCVPCYNPVDGSDTGACTIDPDAPTEAAKTFPTCCPTNGVNRGTCVPTRAAGAQAASLPNLDCETATNDADDYVCAPNEKVADQSFKFPSCTTTFAGPNTCGLDILFCGTARSTAQGYIQGKAGACIPSCFLSEQTTDIVFYGTFAISELYGQSTCATGEDCGPCQYPQGHPQAGESTGLCD